MIFEENYFKAMKFSNEMLEKYCNSADRDIEIARTSDIPEVKFQFAYNALIKLGTVLIAGNGYKVSSRIGHHIKIIEKASEILGNKEILIYGNQMRKTRNTELYDGGIFITKKQAEEYANFVIDIYNDVRLFLKRKRGKLF
jgi:hypothetical protein